jgi:enoyl-CoA hydratase
MRTDTEAIARGLDMSIRDGLAFEIEACNRTGPAEDRRVRVLAFNERRSRVLEGR